MDFLKKMKHFDFTTTEVLKFALVVFVGVIILSFVSKTLGPAMPNVFQQGLGGAFSESSMSEPGIARYSADGDMAYDYATEEVGLSVRNIAPRPPMDDGYTPGSDAEDFEITSYSAGIESRNVAQTCDTVANLKSQTYVIFENTNTYDHGCNYSFKVETGRVDEVLGVIESLNPKDFSTNTQTIKRLVDDYTSQEEILTNKLASIDETLTKAVSAYDEIALLATRTQDVESLSSIINNKINIIERLTQERINTTAQLERLSRSKADQLDRLEYTYFSVNVYEQVFVDGEALKDSWKYAIKQTVQEVNEVVQEMTVGLISFLFITVQFIVYFFFLLFIVKYGWRFTKKIWLK